jgi:hypothetical protein
MVSLTPRFRRVQIGVADGDAIVNRVDIFFGKSWS